LTLFSSVLQIQQKLSGNVEHEIKEIITTVYTVQSVILHSVMAKPISWDWGISAVHITN